LVMLLAVVFLFAVGCKERAEEAEQANAGIKARGEAVEKVESEEAEENEEEAEENEKAEEGEAGEHAVVDLEILPAAVLQALDKAYPGYKILKAEVTTEGGKSYELQIQVDGQKIGVAVDPSGKIIK